MVHIVDIPSYEIIHENDSHGQQYCNNLLWEGEHSLTKLSYNWISKNNFSFVKYIC
jgi:hypothetical protein